MTDLALPAQAGHDSWQPPGQRSGGIQVTLPTLHADQVKAYKLKADERGGEWEANTSRFKALRCGRRWGKTDYGKTIACDLATKGKIVGWFAPDHKTWAEAYEEIADILDPVKKAASKGHGVYRTITGGRIDFWTLDNKRAGRSRKYHHILLDEAAFTDVDMPDLWKKNLLPTLYDYKGAATVFSNTNGVDTTNFFWQICNQPQHGFIVYHAPALNNPIIPERAPGESEIEYQARRAANWEHLRATNHPLVFQQEYLAEFVDWSGIAFFSLDKWLVDGLPVPWPKTCDAVYAVLDTATKTGSENDATAVTFFALTQHTGELVIIDWDTLQIEGSLLETWLPTVFQLGETLARECGSRGGFVGVWIEDKASGEILIQQAMRKSMNVRPIESRLTALGKDERAISVSGYHYQGKVKISKHAHNKTVTLKGATRNHFVSQVTGFRIGDKDAAKRADDLLDTYTYGVALGLGDSGGF